MAEPGPDLNRFISERVSSLGAEASPQDRLAVAAGLTHLLIANEGSGGYAEDALYALFDIAANLGGVTDRDEANALLDRGEQLAAPYMHQAEQ